MQEYYELGVVAALMELEKEASAGDETAQKVAANLPEELKNLPENVKTAAWELREKLVSENTKEANYVLEGLKAKTGKK